MRPMKTLSLVISLVFCLIHLFAGEANRLYVTIDANGKNISDRSETNELLPASQFMKGNWGAASNDIQVSLRFDKEVYTNNEAINAAILVRNVGVKTANYVSVIVGGRDGPVRFFVTTGDGRNAEPVEWGPVEAMSASIPVNSQRKFTEWFNKDYHLTNGMYFVQAYVMLGQGRKYAESSKVPIKIVQ